MRTEPKTGRQEPGDPKAAWSHDPKLQQAASDHAQLDGGDIFPSDWAHESARQQGSPVGSFEIPETPRKGE